jgi:predicted ATPase/class 3 adenylate cyclase
MSVSRRTVTVLFADVAGSTPLGERLDPETVRQVMSRYFESAREVLERHGGTVEKFIGDAVMAVFGVPELHEDDALRAVLAAGELRAALARLNEELEREVGVRIGIRVGVNTGEVIAADGADGHALVTGDAVNTAKRLEESAAPAEILLGEETERLVRGAALLEPAGPIAAKGKAEPVQAWRLLAAIPGVPAIARRFDTPLVGRDTELMRLRQAYERAVEERVCYLFTLLGQAGIGKSRLAAELFDELEGEATVLVGHCLAYGDGITFWPLTQVLQDIGDGKGLEELLAGDADAELIIERLGGVMGRAPSGGSQETFWAVRKMCEALARRAPLVLCFEDVHWAEPTFLDLIEYLAGWIRDSPILLLCLARPELFEARPTWLSGQETAASMTLKPLSERESEALLDAVGTRDTAWAPIIQAAEGNPLYVEQMAAMITDSGYGERFAMPPTIQALLAARLDRLGPGERDVVERAAVAGKEFWRDAVVELTPDHERDEVGARLMSLVRKDLIRPDRSAERSDDAYRFGHALIRDAAYAGIPKETRAALHQRFARWLEANTGERRSEFEEILGYHLEQAFRFRTEVGPADERARAVAQEAGTRLASAGMRAYDRGDMPAAVNLLDRAAALLSPSEPSRLQLLPTLGSALIRAGEFGRADALLTETVDAAEATGDRRLRTNALIEQGFLRSFTEPELASESIRAIADEAIQTLEEIGDDRGLAKAWWLRSEVDVIAGRWGARAEALERALRHSQRAVDSREEATLIALHVQALYYGPTPVEEAVARCENLLATGPLTPALEAEIALNLGGLRAMCGDFEEARRLCAHSSAILEELGLRLRRAQRCLVPASVEMLAGDPVAAEAELRHGYEYLEEMGEQGVRSTLAAFLADVLCAQGRDEEALHFAEVSAEAAGSDDLVTQVVWRAARAKALARHDKANAGERLAREAADLVRKTDFADLQASTLLSLAQVLGYAGRSVEATPLVQEALGILERKGNVVAAQHAAQFLAETVSRS